MVALLHAGPRTSGEHQKIRRRSNRDEREIRPLRKRRQGVIGWLKHHKPAAKAEAESFWAQRDLRTRIVRRAQHIFNPQFAFLFLVPGGFQRNAKRVRMIVFKLRWQWHRMYIVPIHSDA